MRRASRRPTSASRSSAPARPAARATRSRPTRWWRTSKGWRPASTTTTCGAHALARLRELDDAAAVAQQLACGQEFAGETHVSFILTARFDRCFWKYRRTDKGYGALLMEAGHLSQTLYLLAAALGLGAWVTLAINSVEIEDLLELDGVDEGALAMLGCGVPSDEPSPLDMPFKPLP